MVVRTPALCSLKKGFLPRIHHAAPIGPKESTQLLKQITSSFRRNLDKEHPWQAQEPAAASGDSKATATDPTPHHHVADRHLDSILTNPLFARSGNGVKAQPNVRRVASSGQLKSSEVFDLAVSRGMMTTQRAAGFLATVRRQIEMNPLTDLRKGMAESGAGHRVVRWLRASGLESSLAFLADAALTRNLVPFLLAEGFGELLWQWMATLGSRLKTAQVDEQTALLLRRLMRDTLRGHFTMDKADLNMAQSPALDNAYSFLIRANQTLPVTSEAIVSAYRRHWGNVSWASTVEAQKRPSPSAPLFDLFVDIGRPWDRSLDIAHLELHHPTNPDHTSAVKYLHNNADTAEKSDEAELWKSDGFPKRMASLGVDTVSRLKQVGREDEASWVQEFVTKKFFAWNIQHLQPTWEALNPKSIVV